MSRSKFLTFSLVLSGFFSPFPDEVSAQQLASAEASGRGVFTPLNINSWNLAQAAHLLERAAFGGTPEQIKAMAKLTPQAAVKQIVYGQSIQALPAFDPSPIDAPGMDPFPPSLLPPRKQPSAMDAP